MTIYWQDDQVVVHYGDCLDVLPTLPANSIDACVTDPQYGLSNVSSEKIVEVVRLWVTGNRTAVPSAKGFMGKTWDGFVPPPAMWDECLRVLKPGGHLLCFAGTRMFDLVTLSIRLAGFEIRDSIGYGMLAWVYGCLTDDVEVLTPTGWRYGAEVSTGDLIAQWNPSTGCIDLAHVEQTFHAPWDGPMRVLRNADTDQILTPNHRVYHRESHRKMVAGHRSRWYDSEWQVAEAGALSTWNPVQLPLAGEHDGSGIGGNDYAALLGWVWTEGGFDHSGTGVRVYQSSVNAENTSEIASLFDRLGKHKRYDRERTYRGRTYTETTWFISGDLANRVRADLPGKRPTYGLLWRMTATEKRTLLRAAMRGDGSGFGTRSEQFYQQYEDDLVWLQTLLALIGRSGKVGMRTNRPGGALYLRNHATTELQARHLRDSTTHYLGDVWCVKVPTGAFIARRNGCVFITGNSGFPKSTDIAKKIDDLLGAEREVISSGTTPKVGVFAHAGDGRAQDADMYAANYTVTAPATDEAKQWQGWGSALRPSWEPIIMARKPLEGTLASNTLRHGVGGLNIDACRLEAHDSQLAEKYASVQNAGPRENTIYGTDSRDRAGAAPHAGGRWPPNAVFDDNQAGELDKQSGDRPGFTGGTEGRIRVKGGGFRRAEENSGSGKYVAGEKHDTELDAATYNDSGGASRFFPVFKAEEQPGRWPPNAVFDESQAAELDRQSGDRPGMATQRDVASVNTRSVYNRGLESRPGRLTEPGIRQGFDDSGGASRFFKVVNSSREGEETAEKTYTDEGGTNFAMKPGARRPPADGASDFFPVFKYQAKATRDERPSADGVKHETVKPLELVRWLIRLVTPPHGTVLDCFAGSGTTGEAAIHEHMHAVLIEKEEDYLPVIKARLYKPMQVGFDFEE